MVEATDDDNLPCNISVNHTYVNPTKSKQVSVILLNTNTYNVWICQPLYAATIWHIDLKDWEYEPILTKSKDSDTVEMKLQQVLAEDLREEILSYAAEVEQEASKSTEEETSKVKEEKPLFSTRPNTKNSQFNFRKRIRLVTF